MKLVLCVSLCLLLIGAASAGHETKALTPLEAEAETGISQVALAETDATLQTLHRTKRALGLAGRKAAKVAPDPGVMPLFDADLSHDHKKIVLNAIHQIYHEEMDHNAMGGYLARLLQQHKDAKGLRTYYVQRALAIAHQVDEASKLFPPGISPTERAAMKAYMGATLRHQARVVVRKVQETQEGGGCLGWFANWAKERDIKKYGNADGPDFTWLWHKWCNEFRTCRGHYPQTATEREHVYTNILQSSKNTNKQINKAFAKKIQVPKEGEVKCKNPQLLEALAEMQVDMDEQELQKPPSCAVMF